MGVKMRILLIAALVSVAWAQTKVDFAREVQPILRTRCQACHGAAQQISGLRLDDGEAARKGGYAGAVIVPGKAEESPLIWRVTGAKDLMPMPPSGKKLSEAEVSVLRRWIDEGAEWPAGTAKGAAPRKSSHWAFQPVARPAVPAVKNAAWVRNPVDAFVLARLEREGIAPSPEADRATLLRRVTFDLTGLPPKPEEIRRFVKSEDPRAYEAVVDRLLASPQYAEKWARHWLDVARYADSDGYEKDWVRPHAWRYRQWVIEALDEDMPFDRFSAEQIAGSGVASGFHRMTLTNREGGVDNEQFRFENTVDRTSTVAAVWLGLTAGCAQCHDHKYDPLTQKDFYQLFAFFDGLEEVEIDAPMPGEVGPWLASKGEYRAKREALLREYGVGPVMAAWEKEMLRAAANPGERTDWDLAWDCLLKLSEGGDGERIIRKPAGERTQRDWDVLTDHFIRNYHFAVGRKKWQELKLDELDKKLRELYSSYPQLSQAMAVKDEAEPRQVYLRVRGNYKSNGIAVEADAPGFLPPLRKEGRKTREDLARWLFAAENPLTARVTVNRVWQEYFGVGLVKTAEDFGVQGEKPTHPELLDWLAAEFRESGWRMKRLHRLIVTSAAYRQDSRVRPELEEKDPENRLLARQSRLRLPAESIRDAALAAGGLLDLRVGGKSVRPPQPKGVADLGYGGGTKWEESAGADRYRRGLYVHFQRTTPYPLLMNFDAPKGTVTACRRLRSNTPLQALNLLNDPVFLEAAQALAARVTRAEEGFEERLRLAVELTLGRVPGAREAARLKKYFEEQKVLFDREPESLKALKTDDVEFAAWTGLASVLMNLDEFVTRE
jgi:mono/diheme cytochrome c family protein